MASLANPFTAYSNGPGLAELLRFYVCGLQPRPSVEFFNDNEYSLEFHTLSQEMTPCWHGKQKRVRMIFDTVD
jgi:hypothetical protein